MRVLITADTVGGVWTYAREMVGALGRRGVEFVLATEGGRLDADRRTAVARLPNVRLFESDFRLEWMDDPWADVRRAGEWLLELEAATTPGIVHLNSYAHGALPWSAPVLVVGHSCVLSWWEAVHGRAAPPRYEHYRRAVRAGLRAADLVAAPTRAMANCLERHYGRLDGVRVLPNGHDPSRFAPAARKEPYVFAAGRVWDQAKGLHALGEAAAGLPWSVFIAGDLKHPNGERARTGSAHALGPLPTRAMVRWLASASIYALPARYEPFGLSALEAALSGCALVLGDIPSLREVWGETALFVDPGDGEGLRAALRRLIEDDVLRTRMARRAMLRARTFTNAGMAAAYSLVYGELTARVRRPAAHEMPRTAATLPHRQGAPEVAR